jgi:methyl-accepting chemotaxis protein
LAIDLTKLGAQNMVLPNGTNLADVVAALEKSAERKNAKAGLQRLAVVCENYNQLSIEEAYRLLDPEAFRREIEENQGYKRRLKFLNYLRIILGLLPLIITWGSMSWAVSQYQQYSGPPETFLKLWQAGFPGDPLTFSATGILDVTFLVSFLLLTLVAQRVEYSTRKNSEDFATQLQLVTAGLMKLIATDGLTRMTSDAEIEKVGRIIQVAIAKAFQVSQTVAKDAKDLFDQQIKPILQQFDANVAILHQDLDTLTKDLAKLALNLNTYQQQVNDLTAASQGVAQASTNLATSASTLATTASQQTAAAQEIKREVATLNSTQQNMIPNFEAAQQRVAGTFTSTQQQVITEIRAVGGSIHNAAGDMKAAAGGMVTAATRVENVGQQLTVITPQDVQRIAAEANNFAKIVGQLTIDLQNAAKAAGVPVRGKKGKKPWWRPF